MDNNILDELPEHLLDLIPANQKQKITENQVLKGKISELSQLFYLLKQDVIELHEFGKKNETDQAWRRSLYRAVFSWIEGVVYQIKQVAIYTQGGFYQAGFSPEDLIFLKEESYFLKENGKVKTRYNNFSEIDKNLRFAFLKIVEGFNISTKLEVEGNGWEQFKKAVKIRNQLTHPKSLEDLTVTDEQMIILIDTASWFDTQISKLIKDFQETVEPMLRKIKAEGEANMQETVANAEFVFGRAIKVEEVIEILDELDLREERAQGTTKKIEEAKALLDGLKKDIIDDLING